MEHSCIYCHKQGVMSEEHHLPACLGNFKNYELLKDKICKECNNNLGKVDEYLCRSSIIALYRYNLGIEGRKRHKKVSPIYRSSYGGEIIKISAKHPEADYNIYVEPLKGKGFEIAVPARQIIVKDSNSKYHTILIDDHIKSKKDLKDRIIEMKLNDLEFVECFGKDFEKELLIQLCSVFKDKTDLKVSEISSKDSTKQLFIAPINITNNYFRAIAKISFHYFLKYFSNFSGFENTFNSIKDFIVGKDQINNFVKEINGFFVKGIRNGYAPKKYCHFLSINKDFYKIIGKVHFFAGPNLFPVHYEISLGKNPEKIDHLPQQIGHQFMYFEQHERNAFQGIMEPLTTSKLL